MEAQPAANNMSAIDRALAAAKARKAARDASGDATPPQPLEKVQKKERPAAAKAHKEAASDELREIEKARRDAERVVRLNTKAEKARAAALEQETRKAARDAAKAERRAVKESASTEKKPTHMKKVDRARSKCPLLNSEVEKIFGEITANFSAQQIDALAQHLLVHNRATATLQAAESKPLPMGAIVTITGGETKFIGLQGKVIHTNKLRAKVDVGFRKPVYIYTGQATLVSTTVAAAS
jgi:hypothetical protein